MPYQNILLMLQSVQRHAAASLWVALTIWLCAAPPVWGQGGNTPPSEPSDATVQWISRATVRELGQSPDQAQAVMLSDAWDTSGRFGTWVYRVEFTGPTQSHQWGLYIPRIGNRALITLNGHFLEQLGAFEGDQSDHAPQPHFFSIPAENLNATRNVLELTVQGEKARHAGVSIMAVGPESAVRTFFFWRHLLQTQGSFAIVVHWHGGCAKGCSPCLRWPACFAPFARPMPWSPTRRLTTASGIGCLTPLLRAT
jgi:hypothetical protein